MITRQEMLSQGLEGYYHELADRLAVFTSTINDHIYEHPIVSNNFEPEITQKLEVALELLVECYQIAGSKI